MFSREQIKSLWIDATTQLKSMNNDNNNYNSIIKLVSHIKSSLSEVGFSDNVLEEMTLVMLDNLQISSTDSEVTFMLIEEIIKSEFIQELSKAYKYLFEQFKSRNYSNEHTYKLISLSLKIMK